MEQFDTILSILKDVLFVIKSISYELPTNACTFVRSQINEIEKHIELSYKYKEEK